MIGPTPRMQQVWDAYQRAGGDVMPGAQSRAARELGMSPGGLKSAIDGYRRTSGLPPAASKKYGHRSVTAGQMAEVMARLAASEERQAELLAAQQETARALVDVLTEIRAMLARQPLVLEVRPAHRRKADGGPGGQAEGSRALRSLREVIG